MHNAAFQEGYKAHGRSIGRDENPYNDNPFIVFRQEWFKGWDASQREEDLFKIEIQPKE